MYEIKKKNVESVLIKHQMMCAESCWQNIFFLHLFILLVIINIMESVRTQIKSAAQYNFITWQGKNNEL